MDVGRLICISLQVAEIICFWALKTEILLSTTFSQLLIKWQVKNCKLNMLRYITILSIVFPCSISINSHYFQYIWEVCTCLSTASNVSSKFTMLHPSTCESTMNAKNGKLGCVLLLEYKNVYFSLEYNCRGWIALPLKIWVIVGSYLYLCGNTFGNIIQLEPEPSIRKAVDLKFKICTIW